MNFDVKLTKEQEELMLSFDPIKAMMHVDPITGRSSYFPFTGCRAQPISSERQVARIVDLLKGTMSSWYNVPENSDLAYQHKMAMEYQANYRPRRRGQKKGYR